MPKFLTDEWFEAAQEALNGSEDVREATRGQTATIQQIISDGPDGDVNCVLRFEDGTIEISSGDAEDRDLVMRTDYETMGAMQRGELNQMSAFMSGRVKIEGNMGKVMGLQRGQAALDEALRSVDTEF